MSTPFYRINQQIQAKEVRLLREDGTQIGVVTKDEALAAAKEAGIDAVEIAPMAVPPVVKLIDYKKFLYQLAKKQQAEKASAKKVDLKEVRLTPFMGDNDFQTRIKRGQEFLTAGHKLRISVKFVGRQLTHKEFGAQIMTKAQTTLGDMAVLDMPAKWVGKQYIAVFSANKNGKTKN